MVKKSALQMAAQISGHGPYSGMIWAFGENHKIFLKVADVNVFLFPERHLMIARIANSQKNSTFAPAKD